MEITIHLPELGEGVDSVDVVEILVAVGEAIEEEKGLIEVETEKASVEVPSTAAGTVTEVHVSVGDVLSANAAIVTLETPDGQADAPPLEPTSAPESAPENSEEKGGGRSENPKFEIRNPKLGTIPASPTVRRFAREIGVDLATVSGTGSGGRISIADITDLEKFRKAYKERVASAGGKLTMTAILVKIVASALKQHPTLNAVVDIVNHEIVFRESINIGADAARFLARLKDALEQPLLLALDG